MSYFSSFQQPFILLLRVVGGLGIFLFGMQTMSEGIRKRSGNRLQQLVRGVTATPVLGILTGIGVTAVIQSSSATTVVLVSMVNAGLIGLRQSIAVVMGANIGTTVTAWIISLLGFNFEISAFALPAIALSLPFHFSRKEKLNEIALILLGFGLLFLGLKEMKLGVSVLGADMEILSIMRGIGNWGLFSHLLFVLLGTLLAVAVQSSSAAMTITLTLIYQGWIPFSLAAAIVLGENIGTTVTAYLASLEMSVDAKRCARAHLLFNLFGVLWILLLLRPAVHLVDLLIPGSPDSQAVATFHLAAFHTLFNICNTLLLVWFIPRIEQLVTILIPAASVAQQSTGGIPWVRGSIAEAREANLINAQGAVRNLSIQVSTMTDHVMNSLDPVSSGGAELAGLIQAEEESIDRMEESILSHLSDCALQRLTEEQAVWVAAHMRIIGEFERIGDALVKIARLGEKSRAKKIDLHDDARSQILDISYLVRDFLQYISSLLEQRVDEKDLAIARSMEDEINKFRNNLNKVSRKSIKSGGNIKGELLFMEMVRRFENIGDGCITIVKELSRAEKR